MAPHDSLTAFFYSTFGISLFKCGYFFSGTCLLLLYWKKPYFRARIPTLVLTTSIGYLIREILMLSILSMLWQVGSLSAYFETQCELILIMLSALDILVFWPTLLRLYYISRVASIIKAFYAESNRDLARAR